MQIVCEKNHIGSTGAPAARHCVNRGTWRTRGRSEPDQIQKPTHMPALLKSRGFAVLSRVLIIGAGTGGLCLAQGLKQAGVDVSVFERDRTPTDRLQGYRLHISSSGARAMEHCLPAALFREFLVSVAKPNTAVSFLDSDLNPLLTFPIVTDPNAESRELPVSRITLRKLLLQGLEEVVHFRKAIPTLRTVTRRARGSSLRRRVSSRRRCSDWGGWRKFDSSSPTPAPCAKNRYRNRRDLRKSSSQ